MNIVLMTSGLNPLARQFHTLPGTPVGIIRLHSDDHEHRLKTLARRIYRELSRTHYTTLEEYACFHGLHYREVNKRDVQGLRQCLAQWEAELVVTSTCPIVPMEALEGLEFGAINVHPSELPAYRGGNPIFWQLYDEARTLGATVHALTERVDRGAILSQRVTHHRAGLSKKQWARVLEGELGVECLREAIDSLLIEGKMIAGTEQPEISPSRFAGNLGNTKVHQVMVNAMTSPSRFWDCACYLGYCPGSVFGLEGRRADWRWRPSSVSMVRRTTGSTSDPIVKVGALSISVHYHDRVLRFLPSGLYYMNKLLSFRERLGLKRQADLPIAKRMAGRIN